MNWRLCEEESELCREDASQPRCEVSENNQTKKEAVSKSFKFFCGFNINHYFCRDSLRPQRSDKPLCQKQERERESTNEGISRES